MQGKRMSALTNGNHLMMVIPGVPDCISDGFLARTLQHAHGASRGGGVSALAVAAIDARRTCALILGGARWAGKLLRRLARSP